MKVILTTKKKKKRKKNKILYFNKKRKVNSPSAQIVQKNRSLSKVVSKIKI